MVILVGIGVFTIKEKQNIPEVFKFPGTLVSG